jgi:hypothetical protein
MTLHPQAQGLSVCLDVLEAQLHAGPELQEAFASHVLQAITNAAEYGPCNVELQRSHQLQVRHFGFTVLRAGGQSPV